MSDQIAKARGAVFPALRGGACGPPARPWRFP